MYNFTKEELQTLLDMIGEIPTKYGLTPSVFILSIKDKQDQLMPEKPDKLQDN